MTDEVDLPDIHDLLVKAPKNREYSILASMLMDRAVSSPLPLTTASAPLATTRLLDHVFRAYRPGGTGLIFGEGLSPFSIVCEGHKEMAEVKAMVRKAELVESGTSLSLSDADTLTSSDVRFPTEVHVAVEKLYGWSVAVDVFHGMNHAVAASIRGAVQDICPALHRLVSQMADTPGSGMELVCRVMYELQQDYFQYLSQTAAGHPAGVPDFLNVTQKVLTYRANSLSPLPSQWYTMLDSPTRATGGRTGSPPAGSPREQSGTAATVNPNADRRLMKRFRECDHNTLSAMIGGRDIEIPKHAGKPVCLSWGIKGSCSGSCKRKDQHVRYGRSVNQKLHEFMTDCGVEDSQA